MLLYRQFWSLQVLCKQRWYLHLWEQYPGFIQNSSCLSSSTMSLRPYMQFCATDFNLGLGTPWLFILHLFWQVVGSLVSIQLLQKMFLWCDVKVKISGALSKWKWWCLHQWDTDAHVLLFLKAVRQRFYEFYT